MSTVNALALIPPGNDGDTALADPFEVLIRANNVVLNNQRRDEATPELSKQLLQAGKPPSAHAYFCSPYIDSYLGLQFRPKEFITIPPQLVRERDRVECLSLMGLLPEIEHAWMSVDNVLFLWNYRTKDFTVYRELDQPIVTVALVPPKRGVFQDSVKHMLVVSTAVQVVMLAVTYVEEFASNRSGGGGRSSGSEYVPGRNRRINLRATTFKVSSDGVSMMKITSHPNGRVFMAGRDGNMYEFTYTLEYGFMYSVFFVGDSTGQRKCKRVRHNSSGATPSPVHAILALLGLRSPQRTLADIVVDPLRNVLYTLDAQGNIDLFDLGADGNQTAQKMSRFNLWDSAVKFCRQGTTNLVHGDIFDAARKPNVVSIGVVDPTESEQVSLVAVSATGNRFYLSCGYSGGSRHSLQLSIVQIRCPPPKALWDFLGQQDEESLGAAQNGGAAMPDNRGAHGTRDRPLVSPEPVYQPLDGFPARWDQQEPSNHHTYSAYCCSTLTVLAQGVGPKDPTRLILIGPDFVTRSRRRREKHQGEHPWMRESISVDGGTTRGHGIAAQVQAIAESPVLLMRDVSTMRVRSMMVTSRAPSQAEVNSRGTGHGRGLVMAESTNPWNGGRRVASRTSGANRRSSTSSAFALAKPTNAVSNISTGIVGRAMQWHKGNSFVERPVAPSPPMIMSPGGSQGIPGGLITKDLNRMAILPELSTQLFSAQRELLCLTTVGLQTYARLRPVDHLHELLVKRQEEGIKLFFHDFSRDQAAAMCFSIACGLPGDVGGTVTTGDPYARSRYSSSSATDTSIHQLAITAAIANCEPPNFTVHTSGRSPAGVGDGVTMGDKFNNSALYNGLQLFIARLLRPFWFQTILEVSPGGGGGGSGSKRSADGNLKGRGNKGGVGGTPKFLDVGPLVRPLKLLRMRIKEAFPDAVSGDLAAKAAKESAQASAIASEAARMSERRVRDGFRNTGQIGNGGIGDGYGIVDGVRGTRGGRGLAEGVYGNMRMVSRARYHQETRAQQLDRAYKVETLEVHASFRLISRTLEAVSMIESLSHVARDFPAAKIAWSLLAGMPLWKLVTGGQEHRHASSLLADVVGSKVELPRDSQSQVARTLEEVCPSYFSQADKKTFEGMQILKPTDGSAPTSGSPTDDGAKRKGAELLLAAAKEWKSERALGSDGQLARACTTLYDAGLLEEAVELCLICSRNFEDASTRMDDSGGLRSSKHIEGSAGDATQALMVLDRYPPRPEHGHKDVLEWEDGLYQGGPVVAPAGREDARHECYRLALDVILGAIRKVPSLASIANQTGHAAALMTPGAPALLGGITSFGPPARLQKLLEKCLSHTSTEFHEMLFKLLEVHDKDTLLSLNVNAVENYLKKNPTLLYRYYMRHREYPKAVLVMERQAHAEGLLLTDRVSCLTRAIAACDKCDLDSERTKVHGWKIGHGKRDTLRGEIDVLMAQEGLVRTLSGTLQPLEKLREQGRQTNLLTSEIEDRRRALEEWQKGIPSPTDLYQKALSFFLWEGCLELIQCCEVDDPPMVQKLVRSIIWREVPLKGRSPSTEEFLELARKRRTLLYIDDVKGEVDKALLEEEQMLHDENSSAPPRRSLPVFEDKAWFGALMGTVTKVASDLLGRKANYILPVETMCFELQKIADMYEEAGGEASPVCVVDALMQAGLPSTMLLLAYEGMSRRDYPAKETLQYRWLKVMVHLLHMTQRQPQAGLVAERASPEEIEQIARDVLAGLERLSSADLEERLFQEVNTMKLKVENLVREMSPRRFDPIAFR